MAGNGAMGGCAMSRLLRVLLTSLLIVLILPVTAYAEQADEAKQLLHEATTVGEAMAALKAQIDELNYKVNNIDPTAKNAADALPLLAEAKAGYAELSKKAESMAALTDEMVALDVSEEMKTAAGLMKGYAESWIEFCAFENDAIGKLEILFDPDRMSKLSQADREKLNQELTELASRETELNSQIGDTQQAMTQYINDTDFPEDSAQEESSSDGLGRGMLIAIGVGGLIFSVVLAFVCGYLARRKNRSVVGWALLGFFFAIIALIIILVISEKKPEQAAAAATPPEAAPPPAPSTVEEPAPPPSDAEEARATEPAPAPPGPSEDATPTP
jgi:hypothetical protein